MCLPSSRLHVAYACACIVPVARGLCLCLRRTCKPAFRELKHGRQPEVTVSEFVSRKPTRTENSLFSRPGLQCEHTAHAHWLQCRNSNFRLMSVNQKRLCLISLLTCGGSVSWLKVYSSGSAIPRKYANEAESLRVGYTYQPPKQVQLCRALYPWSRFPQVSSDLFFHVAARVPCGRVIALGENGTTTIQSPAFPDRYPRSKMCSWRVCPPKDKRLEFSFATFDLRQSDKLEIDNGK